MSGCSCDWGEPLWPTVFSQTMRVARKRHECCECKDAIEPGEAYEYVSGCWEGEWNEHKTCAFCASERDRMQEHMNGELAFGNLACAVYCELPVQDSDGVWR